jgi:dimethylargininase
VLHALVREVSRAIGRCELTHLERRPIDLARARAEHRGYVDALERLGIRVHELPEEPELPDSVFVEDTALALDGVAIVLRPGARSRRAETASVARALARHLQVRELEGEGTVDGGDVLRLGSTLFVGRSSRSDAAGAAALRRAVEPLGLGVREVTVEGCLHLKSAVTAIGTRALLGNPTWVDLAAFAPFAEEILEIDPAEPFAANALAAGDALIYPAAAYPRTAQRLARAGRRLEAVAVDELAKAEGAVTCCSILFEA